MTEACAQLLESDSVGIRVVESVQWGWPSIDRASVLAFCRNICHGSKHARLEAKKVQVETRTTTSGAYPYKDDCSGDKDNAVETREHVVVHGVVVGWGDKFVDVETFGEWCVDEWALKTRQRRGPDSIPAPYPLMRD